MSPTAMGWVSVWGPLRGSFVYHLTGLQPQRSNEKLAQGQDINGDNKKRKRRLGEDGFSSGPGVKLCIV